MTPVGGILFGRIVRIQQALKGLNIRMHHIGSTSVPGLMAKPVIDILIETSNVSELDAYDGVMEAIGYLPRGNLVFLGGDSI